MYQAVRKNFEEKVSYIARMVTGMAVTDQSSFLSVDCGLQKIERESPCDSSRG